MSLTDTPSTSTLPGVILAYQRRQREAPEGAMAPLVSLYAKILADLAPLASPLTPPSTAPKPLTLLTVREAAERMGVPPGWLYRKWQSLPFARKLKAKTLRFDAEGLARWVAAQRPQ